MNSLSGRQQDAVSSIVSQIDQNRDRAYQKPVLSSRKSVQAPMPNLISLLGNRGSGKTTILRGVRRALEERGEDLVIEVLEPEVFWPGDSALSILLAAIESPLRNLLLEAERTETQPSTPELTTLEATWERLRRMAGLLELAPQREGSPYTQNRELSTVVQTYSAGYDAQKCWELLASGLLDLSLELGQRRGNPLLVVPVDDVDLRPNDSANVIRDLWMLSCHPRTVFLVSADERMVLNTILSDNAASSGVAAPEQNTSIDNNKDSEEHSVLPQNEAVEQMVKLLPYEGRIFVQPWERNEILSFRSDRGSDSLSVILDRFPIRRQPGYLTPSTLLGYFDWSWALTGELRGMRAHSPYVSMFTANPRHLRSLSLIFQRQVQSFASETVASSSRSSLDARSKSYVHSFLSLAQDIVDYQCVVDAASSSEIASMIDREEEQISFDWGAAAPGKAFAITKMGPWELLRMRQLANSRWKQSTSQAVLLLHDVSQTIADLPYPTGKLALPGGVDGVNFRIDEISLPSVEFDEFWQHDLVSSVVNHVFDKCFLSQPDRLHWRHVASAMMHCYLRIVFSLLLAQRLSLRLATYRNFREDSAWDEMQEWAVPRIRNFTRKFQDRDGAARMSAINIERFLANMPMIASHFQKAEVPVEGILRLTRALFSEVQPETDFDERLEKAHAARDILVTLRQDSTASKRATGALQELRPELVQRFIAQGEHLALQKILVDSQTIDPSPQWLALRNALEQVGLVPESIAVKERELSELVHGQQMPKKPSSESRTNP